MKVSKHQLFKKLKAKQSDKKKVTLYLSSSLYGRLKRECDRERLIASQVIEELIKQLLDES